MTRSEHVRTTGSQPSARGVLGPAGAVSVATMISRLLGVAREMVMARYFGAGMLTDAFNVAYRVPNLFRDLFAEGALSSAFVPTFIRCFAHEGKERAWLLTSMVINGLALVLGLMTLLFYFGAEWFVFLLASGFREIPGKFELTVQMTRILSPFLLLVAVAAVMMGLLNARGSFFVPAMASSMFNICCIAGVVLLSSRMAGFGMEPVVSMALGAVVGGASQILVQYPPARAAGFRYRLALDFSDPALRRIVKLMLPAIVGLSATQINILVDNQIASRFGNGPVSWLNYAFRLMQLPIGVFGVAIATANLSAVSHHAAHGDVGRLRQTVGSSLRLAACLTFPSTVGLIVFREDIVRLLFERGSFLPGDTLETGRVLMLYALALFAYSAVKILVPTFYALQDTRSPVRASVITVAVKIAINFLFIIPFGYLGLALSTAMASWLNFGLLLRKLRQRTGADSVRTAAAPFLKIAAASVLMGLLTGALHSRMRATVPLPGTAGAALHLGFAIAVGIALTGVLLRLFRIEEVRDLPALLQKKLGRRR
ncbi:MAG: murein biosynthesis integral membrane protein MurJ [Acidobacteria bacterium]|nr:murein biosynthesis integral membrane protein MurJ [Acidobacteriota bacterium]